MNLLIFLSDRCNMACDYCFLDLNHGPAVVLELESAKQAIDDHLKRFGAPARFTILGGEPFVHYARLKDVAAAIRERSAKAPVTVVTNGTLACPAKLAELGKLGAQITVSVDGAAASHDRHRGLVGSRGSSLEETLKALEACDKRLLRANMVVAPDTTDSLLTNVEALRGLGFSELSFHLDIHGAWDGDALRNLSKVLEGFARYHRALEAAAPGALRLSHLDSFPETPLEHDYEDVVLGADGRYYPCDGLFTRPYAELGRWAVGAALTGVDWQRRAFWHGAAREFIHARLERDGHHSCAREVYFHALARGDDADAGVRSFHAADEVLAAGLSALRPEAYARG